MQLANGREHLWQTYRSVITRAVDKECGRTGYTAADPTLPLFFDVRRLHMIVQLLSQSLSIQIQFAREQDE